MGQKMSDRLVLCVDRLTKPEILPSVHEAEVVGSSGDDSSIVAEQDVYAIDVEEVEDHGSCDEEKPLLQTVECRICQDEDSIKNLEAPCLCSGSLKFAHRKCVQRWCDEKGDIICEICHQSFEPGYMSPPPPPPEVATIDIRQWTVSGAPLNLHDQRILAVAAERRLLEPGYDEYSNNDSSGTEFFRAATLTLLALLFLRHALYLTNGDTDDDVSQYISLFLLRAAGFLLPCYIVAWAISILQRRREQREAAAIAAADVAAMIQAAQPQATHYSMVPEPSVTPQQEPLE
ncbi:RING/FYVE/PHD zinc finger superfamily protein isoform 2 [Hibiscus syriacus]|uniref:RING/FYVE/PHD zinc finger superfamily protein isoform 2 n=1 Tax=Hibiscus syriacus TaxID=106335 RepID=A0A6A3CBI7_HIBSY|nr:RING/FYVE/PHD zinc finger superfamily protein isoform 2 [Hibiscus syriacus]